jgi:hypothetical protein
VLEGANYLDVLGHFLSDTAVEAYLILLLAVFFTENSTIIDDK